MIAAESGATLSACGTYRYHLYRSWSDRPGCKVVVFCCLNPSVADIIVDDPTIRRVQEFAWSWKCGRVEMVNLFGFRATYPDRLLKEAKAGVDVIGPENDKWVARAATQANCLFVAAWGGEPVARDRALDVYSALRSLGVDVLCLGTNKDGSCKHPLYVASGTKPEPYRPGWKGPI